MTTVNNIWQDDCLNRKPSALFLYNYLINNESVKVLNINSPWGSGKTFFVDRWKDELKLNHICVSFNAWENDFSEEPLLSLVAAINKQMKENCEKSDVVRSKITDLVYATGRALKAASPVVAKGLLQRLSGVNADEVADAAVSILPDAGEKVLEELLSTHEKSQETAENFKHSLSSLFQATLEEKTSLQPTVFIIIDELDRCRPTYAIELLERVKHFFSMENCKFIIASDTEQLAHAVRAVYGEGFDSPRYLKRFFDAEFTLNNNETHKFIAAQMQEMPNDVAHIGYFDSIKSRANTFRVHYETDNIPTIDSKTVIYDEPFRLDVLYIAGLSKYFNTNLREIHKLLQQLTAMRRNAKEPFHFFYAAFLIFLKDAKPDFYREMHSGLDWEQHSPLKLEAIIGRPVPNILLHTDRCNILQFADYYYSCLNKSNQELRSAFDYAKGIHSEILNFVYNQKHDLKEYPTLVDLAHRLT